MSLQTVTSQERMNTALALMAEGEELHKAGEKAGFSNPRAQLYPAIRNSIVQRGIKGFLKARLQVEASPIAYKFLLSVLTDTSADKKLRVEVAKFLMSVAGYNPPKAQEAPADDTSEKPPEEMTNEELRQAIEKIEQELGNRATPIEPIEELRL